MFKPTAVEIARKVGLYVGDDGIIMAPSRDGDITDAVEAIITHTVKECINIHQPEYEDGDIAAIHHHNYLEKLHRRFGALK